jgi:hypothetical protein
MNALTIFTTRDEDDDITIDIFRTAVQHKNDRLTGDGIEGILTEKILVAGYVKDAQHRILVLRRDGERYKGTWQDFNIPHAELPELLEAFAEEIDQVFARTKQCYLSCHTAVAYGISRDSDEHLLFKAGADYRTHALP